MTEKTLARTTSRSRRFLIVGGLVAATAMTLSACSSGGGGDQGSASATVTQTVQPSSTAPDSSASATATTSKPPVPTKPVHVSLFQGDGQTWGVGMILIAQFDRKVTDARPFNKVVKVTINGQPAGGAWFWVNSSSGYAMEAHYRPQHYWPAHSKVEMSLPLKGVSAGPGLAFDDSLTLQVNIGASHVSQVDGASERMIVRSDGKSVKTFGVSLGKANTPTYLGTKVVMQKKNPQHMVSAPKDPHPYSLLVPWSVRLTNSGEFVHAASWNTGNIGSRSTSHGCTNLTVADAQWFYNFSRLGDVVTYTNTGTSNPMPSWDGWGDWNVVWSQWQAGNLLKNA